MFVNILIINKLIIRLKEEGTPKNYQKDGRRYSHGFYYFNVMETKEKFCSRDGQVSTERLKRKHEYTLRKCFCYERGPGLRVN